VTTDDLLAKAMRGERAALDALCNREWRAVYGIAYAALGNVAEAQDLTQEVFLRALRSLDRYQQTGAPFSAYLATIARNRLRDGWRSRRPPSGSLDQASELHDQTDGPETSAIQRDEQRRVRAALARLPDDYQAVIRFRLLEGKSAGETAEIMGRSPGAVRQLQRRALAALRAALSEGARI